MRLPPYLLVRDSGLYFRIAIPKDLQPRLGKTEIRKSLQTYDRHKALLMASVLSANVRKEFSAIRAKMADIPKLDPNQRIMELTIGKVKSGNTTLEDVVINSLKDVEILNQLTGGNLQISQQQLDGGNEVSPPAQSQPPETPSPLPQGMSLEECRISKLYPKFIRTKITKGLSPRSITDHNSTNTLLIEILGDKPVSHVTPFDVTTFIDLIQQLPPNKEKIRAYRGKSIEEVIAIRIQKEKICEEENKDPKAEQCETLSPRTIDKHITNCNTFFEWLLESGFIFNKNPFNGRTIQSKAQRESDTENSRKPFDEDDLRKIFSQENYKTRTTPHDFWVPLIGLFSGMRINEIAQLYFKDIKEINRIWTFDINRDAPDKRLKNKTSKRLVPIHPTLIELGFLDFVEDMRTTNRERLFPHLSRDKNGYGRAPGRNFGDYLDSIGIPDPEKVFHSFRHTFSTTLKRKLQGVEARSELMGHKCKGVNAEVYSDEHRIQEKMYFLKFLSFDGMDFSPLRYSKHRFDSFMLTALSPIQEQSPKTASKKLKRQEALEARKQRYLDAGKTLPA